MSLPAVVPTQAVPDGQSRSDLPVILPIKTPGLFSPLDLFGGGDGGGVGQAQQETRIPVANRTAADSRSLQVREGRLLFGESQPALRGGEIRVAPYFLFELPAKLVGVVIADPGAAGNTCQLVVPELVGLLRPHDPHPAPVALEIAQVRADNAREAGRLRRRPPEADGADRVKIDHLVGGAVRVVETEVAGA